MKQIGAGTTGDGESEYEHWPDDETQLSTPSAVSGYDDLNGYPQFQYIPADQPIKKAAPPAQATQHIQHYYGESPAAHIQFAQVSQAPIHAHAPFQPQFGGYLPYVSAYPAPAYYGFPNSHAMAATPGMSYPLGFTPIYVPAASTAPPASKKQENAEENKKDKPKKPEIKKWQGRTKAEVVSTISFP